MIRRILHTGSKPFRLAGIFMLMMWAFSMARVESATPGTGALTVVENSDEATQDSDGVSIDVESDNSKGSYEQFEPTNEWKTVEEGQALPSGLHVRLNLNTGKNEAKLMEENDGLSYWKKANKEGMVNKNRKSFTRNELKDALKKFKQHKIFDEIKEFSTPYETEIDKKEYKSYSELKDDFKKLNMAIQTEGEIVAELFNKMKQTSDKEELQHILAELEYILHKIDNALLFMDLGGMSELVKLLNSTDTDLRHDTAFVLGSAMQSNPKVQITAMEAGVLQRLITIVSTDSSLSVRKKALYAVSALMRHFPYAQKRFLSLGGLSVLAQLFTQPHTEKMRVQIITLLTDLNTEKIHSRANLQQGNSLQKEKLRQYNELDILTNMVETGWCNKVKSLLQLQDYDTQEKVLATMNQIADVCRSSFKSVDSQLKQLESKYHHLCEEDKANGDSSEDNEFFCTLSKSVSNILFTLENVKDEL